MGKRSILELVTGDTPLEEVQELVRRGEVDVKEIDCDGNNILHKVCSLDTERSEFVEYLVSVGAAVNQVNREGGTPLIICAGKGYLSTLKVLLSNGAQVNSQGKAKSVHVSAVEWATESGHEECALELMRRGAHIWHRRKGGMNLLMIACVRGLPRVVEQCLKQGSSESIHETLNGSSALMLACENGRDECVKVLLDSDRINTNLDEGSLILLAITGKHENCVLELISRGINMANKMSIDDETLLMLACKNGLVKVVKKCLETQDDVELCTCNNEGKTALMLACENNQYDCLQEMLTSGKYSKIINKKSKSGHTALMICAQNGFLSGLKLLIIHGALLDVPSDGEEKSSYIYSLRFHYDSKSGAVSALLLAAEGKHEHCVKELVANGAEIWHKDRKGKNLLMVACEQGLLDSVRHCLAQGSFGQLTARDSEGKTALFYAYKGGQVKCIKELLLDNKIPSKNDILICGDTSLCKNNLLHTVCKDDLERPDIVQLLVSQSNVIDIEDSYGFTPLMICAQKGKLETMKVLISQGATIDAVHCNTRRGTIDAVHCNTRRGTQWSTALLMAAEAKHEECVIELLRCKADIWYVNKAGTQLLILASEQGLVRTVKICLEKAEDGDRDMGKYYEITKKALLASIDHKHETSAIEIAKCCPVTLDTEVAGQNIMMLAVRRGLDKLVQTIYEKCGETSDTSPPSESVLNDLLSISVVENNKTLVRFFISKGASLNSEHHQQNLLVTCVEKYRDAEILKILLSSGANLNSADVYGNSSVLIRAVEKRNEDCVSVLVSHGADITATNDRGQTLLMLAAKEGMLKTVRTCLDQCDGSYVNLVDNSGNNAVMHAINNHQLGCLEQILKSQKCSLDQCKNEVASLCSRYGLSKELKLLQKYSDGFNQQPNLSPRISDSTSDLSKEQQMLSAARRNQEQEVFESIWSGADIWKTNDRGQNLLMIAAQEDKVNVVKYCLANATPENLTATDESGDSVIMYACGSKAYSYRSKNMQCLAEILKCEKTRSIHIDAQSLMETVLKLDKERPDILLSLIKLGASVNSVDKDGFTPLMSCARKNYLRSLHILRVCGAYKNAGYRVIRRLDNFEKHRILPLRNSTALQLAALEGNEQCVLQLASHGASVWCSNRRGENPLMFAADKGLWKVVKLCVDSGTASQINQTNHKGNNAVMLASRSAQFNSLSLLLKNPSCSAAVNELSFHFDLTPLMQAIVHRSVAMTRLLLLYGADPNKKNYRGVSCLLAAVGKNPKKDSVARNITNALDLVTLLLHYGANVNQSHNDETALTIAAANDAPTNVVLELLKGGAEVDHADSDGNTALLYACTNGREKVVKTLLDHGAKVGYINKLKCETALTVAVKEQAPVVLTENLLNEGAYVNHVDKNGHTALITASKKSAERVVELLLKHGADVNCECKQSGETALTEAVTRHCNKIAKDLLKNGASVNHVTSTGKTALMSVCQDRNKEMLKLLLEYGADVNIVDTQTGESPLIAAVRAKTPLTFIEKLLNQRADVNHRSKSGETALTHACKNGDDEVIAHLLKKGASVNHVVQKTGQTALTIAVDSRAPLPVVDMLVKQGASVNIVENNGNTALIYACQNREEKVAKFLLQHEADVKSVSKETGESALTAAVYARASAGLIKELLHKGANPNQNVRNRKQMLTLACENQNEDIFNSLLEHGADVNAVHAATGESALTVAAARARSPDKFMEKLLLRGADVNHKDNDGTSALHCVCRQYSKKSIVMLLLKYGASLVDIKQISLYTEETRMLLSIAGLENGALKVPSAALGDEIPRLYHLCRIPARQHVMNSFPNSNLFHMIPRLNLPQKMKDFLLYNFNIRDNNADTYDFDICRGICLHNLILNLSMQEVATSNGMKDEILVSKF